MLGTPKETAELLTKRSFTLTEFYLFWENIVFLYCISAGEKICVLTELSKSIAPCKKKILRAADDLLIPYSLI